MFETGYKGSSETNGVTKMSLKNVSFFLDLATVPGYIPFMKTKKVTHPKACDPKGNYPFNCGAKTGYLQSKTDPEEEP